MAETVGRARKGLAIYFAVLLVLTAIWEFLIIRTGEPIGEHIGLVYLLMWSPAAASIIVRLVLREGIRDISFRIGGSIGWRSLLLAWLMPVAVGLIAYGGAWVTGLAVFSSSATGFLANLAVALTLGTLIAFSTTAGEEIGWRGYMLTRLFDAKVPRPVLVSGVIWAAWHMPIILSGQYASGPDPTLSAVMFLISVMAMTYFISWLRLRTGSIWPAIVFHASWNSVIQGVFDRSTEGASIWIGEAGIVVAIVNIAIVVFLVRGRWPVKRTPGDESAEEVYATAI